MIYSVLVKTMLCFEGFLSAIINAGSCIVICSVLLVEELQCREGGGDDI